MTISLLLMFVVLLVVTFAMIVALIDRRTRVGALLLLLTIGIVIAGIWALFMWDKFVRRGSPSMMAFETARSHYVPQSLNVPPPIDISANRHSALPQGKTAAASTSLANETSPAQENPTKPSDSNGKSSRPDWADQPPHQQGDVYVVAVESGKYSDPAMRQQMLEAKMVAAANRYIDELLYRNGSVADAVALEPEYLQNFVRARTASPANDETFVRMDFNQRFRDEVDRRYRQFLSLSRLEQLGGIAVAILAGLGGLYSYLRLTQLRGKSIAKPVQSPA